MEFSPAAKERVPLVAVKSPVPAVSAEPMEVEKSTVCVSCASPVRVTVKVMAPPSVAEELVMEKEGLLSSSVMVPVAEPAVELITEPSEALERATEKVSSASRRASSAV